MEKQEKEFNFDNFNQEVEEIAWVIFTSKLGLRFKRKLTPEEKKKITDTPDFDYYREEALKHYHKKIKALDNKKYPEIEVPASGEATWMGGAYVLCFVYSKYNGNFVLKGYYKEVKEYLEKNYTHYFYYMSFWCRGFSRGHWNFWKENIGIFEPDITGRRREKKYIVRPYGGSWTNDAPDKDEIKKKTFKFKRLPKRWIPEFDVL